MRGLSGQLKRTEEGLFDRVHLAGRGFHINFMRILPIYDLNFALPGRACSAVLIASTMLTVAFSLSVRSDSNGGCEHAKR
jgi:hypothetical protein